MTTKQYESWLKTHDWQYDTADDSFRQTKGAQKRQQLIALAIEHGEEFQNLFCQYHFVNRSQLFQFPVAQSRAKENTKTQTKTTMTITLNITGLDALAEAINNFAQVTAQISSNAPALQATVQPATDTPEPEAEVPKRRGRKPASETVTPEPTTPETTTPEPASTEPTVDHKTGDDILNLMKPHKDSDLPGKLKDWVKVNLNIDAPFVKKLSPEQCDVVYAQAEKLVAEATEAEM